MKRKHKLKNKKVPVYVPFNESDSNYMIPFDEEYKCVQDTSEEDIENMDICDLEVLAESLVDDIADYDTIIELQLDPNRSTIGFDNESLKADRRRRQKCVVELRKVRERIKQLKYKEKEVAIVV